MKICDICECILHGENHIIVNIHIANFWYEYSLSNMIPYIYILTDQIRVQVRRFGDKNETFTPVWFSKQQSIYSV